MAQAPVQPIRNRNRKTGRNKCSKHERERLKRYCKKCEIPLCIDCLSEDLHSGHIDSTCKIDDVFQKVESFLFKIFENVDAFHYQSIKPSLRDRQKRKEESKSLADDTIKEIIQKNKQIKELIDSITNNLVQKVEHCQAKFEDDLNKTEQVLKDIRADIVDIKRETTDVIENGTKMDVLETHSKLRSFELPILPKVPDIKCSRFFPAPINKKKLEKLIGYVMEPSMAKQLSTSESIGGDIIIIRYIFHSDDAVNAFVPQNDQVWVHEDGACTVKLISTETMTICFEVDVQIEIEDMAVSKNGDILMTSSEDRCIQRIEAATGEVFSFGEKLTLKPKGLCLSGTKSERVVVCMVEEDIDRPKPNSHRLIHIFDESGRTKKVIEYNDKGEPIFTNPSRITVNKPGNYCVVDIGQVIILHKEGHLIDTYVGQDNETVFEPQYIVCNEKGNLIVADNENIIHLLDSFGQLLRTVKTSNKGIGDIYSLATDGIGAIWIGCDNGIVIAEPIDDGD